MQNFTLKIETTMKAKIRVEKEVEIKFVYINIPLRVGDDDDDDVTADFPLLQGNTWAVFIDIDTGKVENWPMDDARIIYVKVCDLGTYRLIGNAYELIAEIENDYVPNDLIPGKYGDYINLEIDENGFITNWPKEPDISEFFKD